MENEEPKRSDTLARTVTVALTLPSFLVLLIPEIAPSVLRTYHESYWQIVHRVNTLLLIAPFASLGAFVAFLSFSSGLSLEAKTPWLMVIILSALISVQACVGNFSGHPNWTP